MIPKSIFPDNMLNKASSEMTLEGIAGKLETFYLQIHLIHLQTTSYAEHMALNAMYEYLHGFTDGALEKLMGYNGRRISPYKIEPLINTSATLVVSDIMSFASDLKKFAEANAYHDISNLADALSGEAAKCKYLLTLS